MSTPDRRGKLDRTHATLSVRRQCTLLGLARIVSVVLRPPTFRMADIGFEAHGGLRHVSITEHKHVSEAGPTAGRRLEIFTGAGRRRSWSVRTRRQRSSPRAMLVQDVGLRRCSAPRPDAVSALHMAT